MREVTPTVLGFVLVVEAVAVLAAGGAVAGLRSLPAEIAWTTWWTVLVLIGAGVLSTEACLGVERVRRRRSDDRPHLDLSSVWMLASAFLLPIGLALLVTVVIFAHLYTRVWRGVVPLYRVLFSTATVVLAVLAAAAVLQPATGPLDGQVSGAVGGAALFVGLRGFAVTVAAILAYGATNLLLVVLAIVLHGHDRSPAAVRRALGARDDAALELATLAMGALVAAAVSAFGPAHVLLVLPPLVVLHRAVLVRQLEEAARTDGKTGLLNSGAWHTTAEAALHELARVGQQVSVLVLDLDHFKSVNDRFGHLVGDRVLGAVATAVRAEVRDGDVVGRFGGEEFVVLLRGPAGERDAGASAAVVAERIRRRVAALRVGVVDIDGRPADVRLTVSVGGATARADQAELARLLEVADAAMYRAKGAGRDAVRMGRTAGPRVPPVFRRSVEPRAGAGPAVDAS